jgi:hypothetical protein
LAASQKHGIQGPPESGMSESDCLSSDGPANGAISTGQGASSSSSPDLGFSQEIIDFLSSKLAHLRNLTGCIDRDEDMYVGGGTFGDVYRGKWKVSLSGGASGARHPDVAIKVFRSTGSPHPKTIARCVKVRGKGPLTIGVSLIALSTGAKEGTGCLAEPSP